MVAVGDFVFRRVCRLPLRSLASNWSGTDCVGFWRMRSRQTEQLHLIRECKLSRQPYSLEAGCSRFLSTVGGLHGAVTVDSSSFSDGRSQLIVFAVSTQLKESKENPILRSVVGMRATSRSCYSTSTSNSDDENSSESELSDGGDFIAQKPDPQPHGVDPRRGWGFRGVHKKILRNGRTVTIFTVGTGGLYDQRHSNSTDLPKPAQWHRVAIHNEHLGTYAVQQLTKSSSVYVEGDIETRVYNDSISGEVKNVPEICVRHDGKIRLVKSGESFNKISIDELREGLFQ